MEHASCGGSTRQTFIRSLAYPSTSTATSGCCGSASRPSQVLCRCLVPTGSAPLSRLFLRSHEARAEVSDYPPLSTWSCHAAGGRKRMSASIWTSSAPGAVPAQGSRPSPPTPEPQLPPAARQRGPPQDAAGDRSATSRPARPSPRRRHRRRRRLSGRPRQRRPRCSGGGSSCRGPSRR